MPLSRALIVLLIAASVLISGCGGSAEPNTGNSNKQPSVNGNSANAAPGTDPVGTTKKPAVETTNNAPTLGPVIRAYYDALQKKDDLALQKVLSSAYLAKVAADMKKEKKTGLAAYLAEYDTVPDKPVEVRNEKIDGSKAVAEVKGGAYLNWTGVGFINEGATWKITGESSDITNVTTGPNAGNRK